MSMEIHVLFSKNRLPDLNKWQIAIDQMEFDVKLDPVVAVDSQSGFLPARFKGSDSGFEFHLGKATDVSDTYTDFKGQFITFSSVATFCWGGDLAEACCAMAASAAFAKITAGLWFDPQEGKVLDGDAATAHVKDEIAGTEQFM